MKNDANMTAIRSAIGTLVRLKLASSDQLDLRFRVRLDDLITEARQLHNDILADANAEGTPSLFREGQ